MQKPTKDTPTADYIEHSAFTCAAVAADPDAAGLEADLLARHVALKQDVRLLEDHEEEKQRRRAVLIVKDRRCDTIVRRFELRLYGLVDKQRNDPLYRRYFQKGLRDVTEANMRTDEPQKVGTIIQSLEEDAQKPGIGDLTTEFRPQLVAARGEVVAAEAALTTIEGQIAYLSTRTIPDHEALWTDEYVKLHGALKARFPRDAARVESYFEPFRKSPNQAETGGDETPEEPAPGESGKAGDAR